MATEAHERVGFLHLQSPRGQGIADMFCQVCRTTLQSLDTPVFPGSLCTEAFENSPWTAESQHEGVPSQNRGGCGGCWKPQGPTH